jgi:hypothetical protein
MYTCICIPSVDMSGVVMLARGRAATRAGRRRPSHVGLVQENMAGGRRSIGREDAGPTTDSSKRRTRCGKQRQQRKATDGRGERHAVQLSVQRRKSCGRFEATNDRREAVQVGSGDGTSAVDPGNRADKASGPVASLQGGCSTARYWSCAAMHADSPGLA